MHDRHSFIAWFIRQAMEGGVIELFGEGKQRRDLNYVDDVTEALLLAGANENAEGGVFNLGGQEPIILSALADELINLTGRGSVRCLPFPPERQSIEIGNAYSTYEKIQSVLGWRPRTSLREGLTRTIQFYQKDRDHYWKVDADTLSRSKTTV
jgi:UDP-glucose 4-epimerase